MKQVTTAIANIFIRIFHISRLLMPAEPETGLFI